MRQILPGVWHWVTFHERIGSNVSSYYITAVEPAALVDPRVPREKIEWFDGHPRPENIFLTNRHHYRHSGEFAKRFGSKVWCHRAGLHEFRRGRKVAAFDHGDELPGGVLALEVGALCPEETALFIPEDDGIVCLGDAVIRRNSGPLRFVPDEYMGDDPEGVKRGLRRNLGRLLRRKFDALLLAHGSPIREGAKDALRAFLDHEDS